MQLITKLLLPQSRKGGEPAIISVGGAIANAVFDACGARVFRMPLSPQRVLDAMKKQNQAE